MDLDTYLQTADQYVSPSVFEFDPNPPKYIDMAPKYVSQRELSPEEKYMQMLGFPIPYKSQEELEIEQKQRENEEEQRNIEERNRWLETFKTNHITLNLEDIEGNMTKDQLKYIKGIMDKDDDYTYIYAGSKDRTEYLDIDDVCGHVVSSRIKKGKLECDIEYDYSPARIKNVQQLSERIYTEIELE